MEETAKVKENRVRRAAQRQGMVLAKSRARDPRALGYGTYQLRGENGQVIKGGSLKGGWGLTLDQIEQRLRGEDGEEQ